MAAVADDIWAIVHEVAQRQKELQDTQRETDSEIKALTTSVHLDQFFAIGEWRSSPALWLVMQAKRGASA
jgi:Na+/H+ antiporter NhaB